METTEWLAYFETNAQRPSPDTPESVLPLAPALHGPLVRALQCFQLGESGEGRVAGEAARSSDPALDDALKTSVMLYVREEGRHARELARLLQAMGEPIIRKHVSEQLFERSRRMLGLRAKMAVIAVAEVVGSTFYATLSERIPCRHVGEVCRIIAAEEDMHLAFQRDYFRRVMLVTPRVVRPVLAAALCAWFLSVLMGAIVSVALGQRKLFVAMGMGPWTFAMACLRRLGRFLGEPDERQSAMTADCGIAVTTGRR